MNYDSNEVITWSFETDCDSIVINSNVFAVEQSYDFLVVDGVSHTGEIQVDQTVSSGSFDMTFTSDHYVNTEGFSLDWACGGDISGKCKGQY